MTRCSVEPASSAAAACRPRRRRILVALEGRVDESAVEEGRQIEDRQPDDDAGHQQAKSGLAAGRAAADAAVASAPAPSARPKMLSGSALVLLRIASDSVERDDVASRDISGDGSAMGWTPTASTMPTKTSSAAYLRWLQRVSAMPATQHNSRANPMAMMRPDSR